MGAVKNKPGLQAPNQLFVRYSGVPVVYVESEEDYYIFGEWFKDQLSRLEFLAVNNRLGSSASGCGAVIEAVRTEVASGNPAWGIVDRDAVMSADRWDLVHEIDDSCFDSSLPFGQRVKVLRRWEMESYLVDGDLLEQHRSELLMQAPRSSAEVWGELLADCQALIPHAALNATHHDYKKSGLGDGCTDRFQDREEVESSFVENILISLEKHHLDCRDLYAQHLNQVAAFDTTEAPLEPRVQSLLRRVHGKAVLSRFKSRHRIRDDFRGLLAARIKTAGRVPEELSDFVQMAMNS
ncbi:hypothetical protein [Polaromonas sp.]|uniref:hypothetical protein n=1 Tax=Polaromonas sp. TaxID=1869339 RepID=UPI003BB4BC54